VVAAEEFRRSGLSAPAAALIVALQASPYRDIDIEPRRERLPVPMLSCDRWLLDTNVLCELRSRKTRTQVVRLRGVQALDLLFVSTVTFAEIRFGIERVGDARAARN